MAFGDVKKLLGCAAVCQPAAWVTGVPRGRFVRTARGFDGGGIPPRAPAPRGEAAPNPGEGASRGPPRPAPAGWWGAGRAPGGANGRGWGGRGRRDGKS